MKEKVRDLKKRGKTKTLYKFMRHIHKTLYKFMRHIHKCNPSNAKYDKHANVYGFFVFLFAMLLMFYNFEIKIIQNNNSY